MAGASWGPDGVGGAEWETLVKTLIHDDDVGGRGVAEEVIG